MEDEGFGSSVGGRVVVVDTADCTAESGERVSNLGSGTGIGLDVRVCFAC